MDYWTGAAAGITSGVLAVAFVIAGVWLARGGRTAAGDHEHWFLASIILLIIAAADRLTLLDGQLLSLAALLLLWWDVVRRTGRSGEAGPVCSSVVGRCGFGVLLTATAGLGLITIALVVAEFVSALRTVPGGWASLSWFDSVAMVAEVARSRPSLRGLSVLAPSAWLAGVVAVVTLWITVLPALLARVISRFAGAAFVGGGLVVAARLVFQ